MKINNEIKQSLTALYVTILVKNKHNEPADARQRFKRHAEDLDKQGVPFALQNLTAAAGDNPSNWERYNSEVINEVIEKYNNIIEKRTIKRAQASPSKV